MASVLKVGGSLAKDPEILSRLCKFVSKLAKKHELIVVPGGGKFADVVREFDGEYCLSDEVSHRMALLAVDQYGMLLADLTSNSETVHTIEEAKDSSSHGRVPILLPARLMFRKDPLKHSWDVTSDSVAAWIAGNHEAERLILVTDVDGIFSESSQVVQEKELVPRVSAKELMNWKVETCVDKILPRVLLRTGIKCHVLNGKFPDRIESVLEGRDAIQTEIFVSA